jgi:1-acyl-sn-glycerol-3-phosphate acyltransferase
MIKARHHWFYARFFRWYIPSIIKSDFHAVRIFGMWKPLQKSALIIGNHVSWWDGFWAYYLNSIFLKKRFHVMMLEEQLRNRTFFSKAGAYSINPRSRDVLNSLDYTAELLANSGNAVLLFPQGKLHSLSSGEFVFEKGIERILKQEQTFKILFYAAFIDYLSNRKPSIYFYLDEVEHEIADVSELQHRYQEFYNKSREQQATLKE